MSAPASGSATRNPALRPPGVLLSYRGEGAPQEIRCFEETVSVEATLSFKETAWIEEAIGREIPLAFQNTLGHEEGAEAIGRREKKARDLEES